MKKTKLIMIWCSMLLIFASPFLLSQNYGDVDENGYINIVDALFTARFYTGSTISDFNKQNADVNCDETIDIVDALLIAKCYVSEIINFPCEEKKPIPVQARIPFQLKYGQTAQFHDKSLLSIINVYDKRIFFDPKVEAIGIVEAALVLTTPHGKSYSKVVFTGSEFILGQYRIKVDSKISPNSKSVNKKDYIFGFYAQKFDQTRELGETFPFAYYETVNFDGQNILKFEYVRSDNRCPSDIPCTWPGEVKAEFILTDSKGENTRFSLSSINKREALIKGYVFTIGSQVQPPPPDSIDAMLFIKRQVLSDYDYIINLTINKAKSEIREVPLGKAFKLNYSKKVLFDGLNSLQFVNIFSDQRCPLDRVCAFPGELLAEFSYIDENKKRVNFILSTLGNNQKKIGEYLFTMSPHVLPQASDNEINKFDYISRLIITKSNPTPKKLKLHEAFKLSFGEKVYFDGKNTLEFIPGVNDSRCPLKTNCIWKGEVQVKLKCTLAGSTPTLLTISSDKNTQVNIGDYSISMGPSVLPQRSGFDKVISDKDYKITLKITKSKQDSTLVWVSHPSGYKQCEPLIYATLREAKEFLEKNGVTIVNMVKKGYAVCAACGCPTGTAYLALIPEQDLKRAQQLGWIRK